MNTTRSAEQGRIRVPVGARRFIAIALAIYIASVVGAILYAQDAPVSLHCPARVARVLDVKAEGWSPSLMVKSPTGGTAKLTPCNGIPFTTKTLPPNGSFALDDWSSITGCGSASQVRVINLPVEEGSCLTYTTEAVFRDGDAVVAVPEFREPLQKFGPALWFDEVRSTAPRSTFIALIAEDSGVTRAAVTLYDGDGVKVSREVVDVDAFAWYAVPAVNIGSVSVENIGTGVDDGAGLYVVAFAGYRDGGSPRVIEGEVRP